MENKYSWPQLKKNAPASSVVNESADPISIESIQQASYKPLASFIRGEITDESERVSFKSIQQSLIGEEPAFSNEMNPTNHDHNYSKENFDKALQEQKEILQAQHAEEIDQLKNRHNQEFIQQLSKTFDKNFEQLLSLNKKYIYQTALEYSKRVAQAVLEKHPIDQALIDKLVKLVLEKIPHNLTHISIKVHPELIDLIQASLDNSQISRMAQNIEVLIVADQSLKIGDIDLEHNLGGATISYEDIIEQVIDNAYQR